MVYDMPRKPPPVPPRVCKGCYDLFTSKAKLDQHHHDHPTPLGATLGQHHVDFHTLPEKRTIDRGTPDYNQVRIDVRAGYNLENGGAPKYRATTKATVTAELFASKTAHRV